MRPFNEDLINTITLFLKNAVTFLLEIQQQTKNNARKNNLRKRTRKRIYQKSAEFSILSLLICLKLVMIYHTKRI